MSTTTTTRPPEGVKLLLPSGGYGAFHQHLGSVCSEIVRRMAAGGWEFPGVTVEFSTYSHDRLAYIWKLTGQDWQLRCGMNQGRVYDIPGDEFNIGGLTRIISPGFELHVADEQGGKPDLRVYAGTHWEADREAFIADPFKLNSRLDDKPRLYLRYDGGCMCERGGGKPHLHEGRFGPCPLFIHTTDWDREHDLVEGEPKTYEVKDVYTKMGEWFRQNLLDHLPSA